MRTWKLNTPQRVVSGQAVSDQDIPGQDIPGRDAISAAAPHLAVTRLSLRDFRCYQSLELRSDGRPVVLAGPNGAGKTNILEALSYLAPGRGLRGARLAEIDRRGGAGPWTVAATVETPDGPVKIGTGRAGEDGAGDRAGDGNSPADRDAAPARRANRRIVRIDGRTARGPQALTDVMSILWLTPSMDRVFTGSPGARRRFLDRLVFGIDPAHASRLSAYERAMRERNRLLKGGENDAAWLAALEETMSTTAVAISAARRETAQRMTAACARGIGPFPAAGLEIEGAVESWLDQGPALAAEDKLRCALADGRANDAATGGASIGPHKSDLAVHHVARDMPAPMCSTGEQKALLIAMVLANARLQAELRGAMPLLLLDEVVAHLDASHRGAMFEEIFALGAQAWFTGTDMGLFAALGDGARFFHVADAGVDPARGTAPDMSIRLSG